MIFDLLYVHLAMLHPRIHLYESLCSELKTDYYLKKNCEFSTEINTLDASSKVGSRIIELAAFKGPAKGLSDLLNRNPVVVLNQIENEFGWFEVLPAPLN